MNGNYLLFNQNEVPMKHIKLSKAPLFTTQGLALNSEKALTMNKNSIFSSTSINYLVVLSILPTVCALLSSLLSSSCIFPSFGVCELHSGKGCEVHNRKTNLLCLCRKNADKVAEMIQYYFKVFFRTYYILYIKFGIGSI